MTVPESEEIIAEDYRRTIVGLIEKGLVTQVGDGYVLTETGTKYALMTQREFLYRAAELVYTWFSRGGGELEERGWESDLLVFIHDTDPETVSNLLTWWVTETGDHDLDSWEERFMSWLGKRLYTDLLDHGLRAVDA